MSDATTSPAAVSNLSDEEVERRTREAWDAHMDRHPHPNFHWDKWGPFIQSGMCALYRAGYAARPPQEEGLMRVGGRGFNFMGRQLLHSYEPVESEPDAWFIHRENQPPVLNLRDCTIRTAEEEAKLQERLSQPCQHR
jgi:hypothetical protein